MMSSNLKTASGRAFRTTGLFLNASLTAAKAANAPGSIALNSLGDPFVSCRANPQGDFEYRPVLVLTSDGRSGQIAALTGGNFPGFTLLKGRESGGVVSDDVLGIYQFGGVWPSAPLGAITCRLQAVVDSTPSSTSFPTRFDAFVTPAGATMPTRGLRLSPDGNLLLGNTTGTERLSVTGNIQLTNTADSFKVGSNNVVGSRKTGWAAPTGTATRTTFATSTVTTAQLAERVKALIDDLTAHGLIGA